MGGELGSRNTSDILKDEHKLLEDEKKLLEQVEKMNPLPAPVVPKPSFWDRKFSWKELLISHGLLASAFLLGPVVFAEAVFASIAISFVCGGLVKVKGWYGDLSYDVKDTIKNWSLGTVAAVLIISCVIGLVSCIGSSIAASQKAKEARIAAAKQSSIVSLDTIAQYQKISDRTSIEFIDDEIILLPLASPEPDPYLHIDKDTAKFFKENSSLNAHEVIVGLYQEKKLLATVTKDPPIALSELPKDIKDEISCYHISRMYDKEKVISIQNSWNNSKILLYLNDESFNFVKDQVVLKDYQGTDDFGKIYARWLAKKNNK